ncbi:MAG: hypothetical protein ACKPKO_01945, partial [Candidatus Fonsibacter sp.]
MGEHVDRRYFLGGGCIGDDADGGGALRAKDFNVTLLHEKRSHNNRSRLRRRTQITQVLNWHDLGPMHVNNVTYLNPQRFLLGWHCPASD